MRKSYTFSLIDDFGIWQHAVASTPLPEEGYALDDATRGLILCLLEGSADAAGVLLRYIAASYRAGQWYGFATADRSFVKAPASDDAVGQIIWATGLAIDRGFEPELARQVYDQAKATLVAADRLAFRGHAYALLGAIYVEPDWSHQTAQLLLECLAAAKPEWPWPDEQLTYAKMIIPYALLRYGHRFANETAIRQGQQTLDFIQGVCESYTPMGPVGNNGWYKLGDKLPARFDQQPIDGAYAVWAHLAHYEITGQSRDLESAQAWIDWFHGDNVAGLPLGNPETGQCFDGISGPDHISISRNSGAESNICYALSLWAIRNRQTF